MGGGGLLSSIAESSLGEAVTADVFERNFTIGDGETIDDRVPSFQRNTKSSLSRNKVISEERLQRS